MQENLQNNEQSPWLCQDGVALVLPSPLSYDLKIPGDKTTNKARKTLKDGKKVTCIGTFEPEEQSSDEFPRFPYCLQYIPKRVLQKPPSQNHQQAQIKFSKNVVFLLAKGLRKECPNNRKPCGNIYFRQTPTEKSYHTSPHFSWPAKSWPFILPPSPYPMEADAVYKFPTGWSQLGRAGTYFSIPCLAEAGGNTATSPPDNIGGLSGKLVFNLSPRRTWQHLNSPPCYCHCCPLVSWASTLTGINEADKVVQVESSKHFILPHSPPHVSWAHWGPKPPLPFFSNKVLLVSPLFILYLVAAWPESERNLYSYLDTIRQCDLWCLIFKEKESVEQTRELSVFSSNMKWGSVSQCFSIAGWYCGPPGPHVTPQ